MSTNDADRSLRRHRPDGGERKIGWLELFYDLIYVATIIQIGDMLARDASTTGILLFVVLFVPVWWSWTGMMFYFNRFVADDVVHRVLVFVQMFAVAHLAIAASGAFGEASVAFALAYGAVRLVLVVFYLRAWRIAPEARGLIRLYAGGFTLAAVLWLGSALVPPPYRFGLWVLGLALEFYVALAPSSRRLQTFLPPDLAHFAERFGLFTIIVLGESFIKVVGGLAGKGVGLDALVLSGLGFAVVASVWWLYFDHTHVAVVRSSAAARYLWVYGHLPLTVGVTALGVALKKVVLLPMGEPVGDTARWLFGGAVALCLLALAVLESVRRFEHARRALRGSLARGLAAAAALALAAFGGTLPAGGFVVVLAIVCVALVGVASRLAPSGGHAHG